MAGHHLLPVTADAEQAANDS